MLYKIEVRRLKKQPVLAIRRRTSPQQLGDTLRHIYAAIGAYLNKHDVDDAGPPFTRYHDSGGGSGEVDVECGLFVKEALDGEGDIYCGELPGGLAAVALHRGDYQGLSAAHEAVTNWIERNGKKPEGGSWEVYLNDPAQVKDQKDWKTEVCCVMAR